MKDKPNILFIMADQLRYDYLGCYGNDRIRTPNIDLLAARGTKFDRAYIQAPVCGGSRMCFYTGRYNVTHGATHNGFPLRLDEKTIGDYLRPLGYRVALVGKTHFATDMEAASRLGVSARTETGGYLLQCGFEAYERDDGVHSDKSVDPELRYNSWLRQHGYQGSNPWHEYANSVVTEGGEVASGWNMRNAGRPARVKEEHSETAYMTDRALAFLDEAGTEPWFLHLSYIKPHWPYVAPAPYHNMYSSLDVKAANRADSEKHTPHPVLAAFMKHEESVNFSREEVRQTVIPTYMGLISQFDHHVGRVVERLRSSGQIDNTIIVVTSDHGDYLGDHWLGEKDLFHEEIIHIPLVLVDPRSEARPSRGRNVDQFVEAIDLLPTFLEWAGGLAEPHRLEGASIVPILAGHPPDDWRSAVFCDSDYSLKEARKTLGLAPDRARGYMIRTERWKYVLFEEEPPLLFDMQADPHELFDLGSSLDHKGVRAELAARLFTWFRQRKLRVTVRLEDIERLTGKAKERGFPIGVW